MLTGMLDLPPGADSPLLRPRMLADGWTVDELRRARRAGDLRPIDLGAYLRPGDPRLSDPIARHRLRVAAAVPRFAAGNVVSHASAAVLHGLPLWQVPLAVVHATRSRRNGAGRTGRLHVHPAPLDPAEVTTVDGVLVTTAARTVVDLARTVGFAPAVVVADAALHDRLVTDDELSTAVERIAGWPGAPAARRVVAFADGRSESPGESRSRVALARAGLAADDLQHEVCDGDGKLLRVDFWWFDPDRAGEFDGRVKYGRLLRPGQDPGDAVFAEKLREDAIRATGVRVVRWTWHELDDFARVAARIRGPHTPR